jgi:hypothetical protein
VKSQTADTLTQFKRLCWILAANERLSLLDVGKFVRIETKFKRQMTLAIICLSSQLVSPVERGVKREKQYRLVRVV